MAPVNITACQEYFCCHQFLQRFSGGFGAHSHVPPCKRVPAWCTPRALTSDCATSDTVYVKSFSDATVVAHCCCCCCLCNNCSRGSPLIVRLLLASMPVDKAERLRLLCWANAVACTCPCCLCSVPSAWPGVPETGEYAVPLTK